MFLTGDDNSTGITHFSTDMLERGLPYESRSFDGELDTPEELHAVQCVSGRSYAMVGQRVPDRLRGRGRENVQDRGRSPTRRWGQQNGYHEQIGSRGRNPEQLSSRGVVWVIDPMTQPVLLLPMADPGPLTQRADRPASAECS